MKHATTKTLLVALAGAALFSVTSSSADPPTTGVLTIGVTSLRSNNGHVGCAVYNSAQGFPTDPARALQRVWCPISTGASRCSFDPIPAGTYAVACFHDENDNGKLDTGLLGIPTEGVLASNQAKGFMGPPSFDRAKFSFSGATSELHLKMGY
jgi:uncharacterized protein (DUF2141 family)